MPDEQAAPILELTGVTLAPEEGYTHGLDVHRLRVEAGDLVMVLVQESRPSIQRDPLADVIQGLVDPRDGRVAFDGVDWRGVGPDRAAELRSRIGRFQEYRGLISNLDIDENIFLAQLHHTRKPLEAIREEAEDLARRFRLGEIPSTRPAASPPSVVHAAKLIRAFMGKPRLVLLERPEEGAKPETLAALTDVVAWIRGEGKAAVWWTEDRALWTDEALGATARYRMQGARLLEERHE